MRRCAILLLGLLACAGCGSTTEPNTGLPPSVAGAYLGVVVFFPQPGAIAGDTLEAAVDLAQAGATVTGSWRAWAPTGTDSVWGSVDGARLVRRAGATPASDSVWHATGTLTVARGSCAGSFTVDLEVVPVSATPARWMLDGTCQGAAACFRGGGAQSGEWTVVQGAGAPGPGPLAGSGRGARP
ncbi:MAG: hypothetical protein HZB25_06370 [Candidatus Eisenbacteria bacterium]|nr:hypothetical protein [Candidatus Eisenbacteria bacterium]